MSTLRRILALLVCATLLLSLWAWTTTHANRARLAEVRVEVAQMRENLREQEIANSRQIDKIRALMNDRHALAEHAIVHYELVRPDEILVHLH